MPCDGPICNVTDFVIKLISAFWVVTSCGLVAVSVTNVLENRNAFIFRVMCRETMLTTYKSTRRHKPEDHNQYHQRSENLKY
jgi:hypothetical protein